MKDIFTKYIKSISIKFSHKETSEMGYRTDFEIFMREIFDAIKVKRIDHDPKAKEGNKPDFVVIIYDVPILYIETKDIGVNLDKIESSKQMIRYFGYTNLVLTDYVEFRFYRNGLAYEEPIKIAEYDIKNRTISPFPDNYEHLAKTLIDFAKSHKEPIKSGEHLAKIMAGKAQRIRDNVRFFLSNRSEKNKEIIRIYDTIKKLLVHDLTKDSFADMYAQTLVYGLFVARYYDKTPESFTRQEARDLVPASNPFLRHFFDHIVGPDFDKRLEYIVNELCVVFSHSNVSELMRQYFKTDIWGKSHAGPDPVIHFYEDFLKEYDPELRKKLGAYYTPLPVVRFIIRSVNYILKKDFSLHSGLADTSKLPSGIHRVQILDPAVGTGTFISEVIGTIYKWICKSKQKGRWPTYVHHDLLPRLHGFEIMMAPYTIAHLKLSMAFGKTGFKYFNKRLGIYLTNSLEGWPIQDEMFPGFGFAESIAEESKKASVVKDKTPIMVVIGNPPYSVSSSNKGQWIQKLIEVYKKGLNERNINALSDDYVKFIRFAEHFIEKNKTGIVGMITNNSFIDGVTHRQMRKHLLETFDDIYIFDLHGSSKKKEKALDGGKDENVFDIQQGVAISIFVVKKEKNRKFGVVHHAEVYGKREDKFKELGECDIQNVRWNILEPQEPYYFFVAKDFSLEDEYKKGFSVNELFVNFGSGIKFRKDNLLIKNHFNRESVGLLLRDINTMENSSLYMKYHFNDTSDWRLNDKKKYFTIDDINNIRSVQYRPFDIRYTYYPLDVIHKIIPRGDSRRSLMKNFFNQNIGLSLMKGLVNTRIYNTVFAINDLMELNFYGFQTYVFPVYLYTEDGSRITNFNKEIVDKINIIVDKVSPEEIFDYIYAILHSSNYRKKYIEFLKIDFPRIPYPKNIEIFKKFVTLGAKLRSLHLLQSPTVMKFITSYPVVGSNEIEKLVYKGNKVYINKDQYFGNVPKSAWGFCIGGYQPAQKWLKDRKNHTLTNNDIEHYQKMIVALVETEKIMLEIGKCKIN